MPTVHHNNMQYAGLYMTDMCSSCPYHGSTATSADARGPQRQSADAAVVASSSDVCMTLTTKDPWLRFAVDCPTAQGVIFDYE